MKILYKPHFVNSNKDYYTISTNILNPVFVKLKDSRNIQKYSDYVAIFDGPKYDADGVAYYTVQFTVTPIDNSIEYRITRKAVSRIDNASILLRSEIERRWRCTIPPQF